jgi:N-carbamoyl-L-amino-acid hydrolase
MKTLHTPFVFFLLLALSYNSSIIAQSAASTGTGESLITVNKERLENYIITLANYGKDDNGETSRVAFSDADLQGRDYVLGLMLDLGLEVTIDAAGNIIGKRQGKNAFKKPIVFGSHIDTVPNGGNYDGCVGSMAAIEVIHTLNEQNIVTRHPLEIIIFSNEEGGVMGSRALAGELSTKAMSVTNSTGYTMREGIARIGGDVSRLDEVIREEGSMKAFLELHIEQGGILAREKLDIGIVEGIVGLNWWDVTFTGFANHAGTTPMNLRQDALLAASKFITAVNEVANKHEGKHVCTVGRISAEPGAPNVIPGKVVLSLEIRDLSSDVISMLYKEIEARGMDIAQDSDVGISINSLDTTGKPALTNTNMQKVIEESSKALGLTYKYMQSGAGHDAQDMALIAPTAMIFVPSKEGISHSPKEFTTAQDMANGANVLLQTILQIDKE